MTENLTTESLSETFWAWLLFGGYCVVVAIATWARGGGRSLTVFSIGSRDLPPAFVGLSVAAGATSTATFVVNPGLVYLYGWSGFVAIFFASSLGFFVGLIIFSKRFRQIGDRFSALTLPQWIGDRYGSEGLKLFFSGLSFLNVAYIVLIAVAMSLVLAKTLGIAPLTALIFIVLFTYGYILVGGAGTHVLANVVQAGVMVIVAVILVGSAREIFSAGLFSRAAEIAPHYASWTNPDSQLYRDLFEVFVAQFVVGIAAALLPHLIAKPLYLRRESDVNVYLGTAVVAVLVFKSVLIVGIAARMYLDGDVLPPDQVMATYIVERFSPVMRALVGLGVMSAGFSTLEGIVLSLSTIFSNDILGPLARKRGTSADWEARAVRLSRWFIVALAPITIALSYRQIVAPSLSVIIFAFNGIFGIMVASVVPVSFGIYVARPPVRWLFASSLVALGVFYGIVWFDLTPYHDNPMVPATLAIVASFVVMILGMFVSGSSWKRLSATEPSGRGRAS